ncbi:hypothetical protein [Blastomonas sp. SL216]|uniref:hypothetical protein n=1 Tax=Blastomonas sp. SL216 TaxID=2995169 RepID=UPI00237707C5|nr:hypothetical protein OU999_08480 [Blastomonas sp. SL216]
MSENEQAHSDIFLFMLGNGDDGYAKVRTVLKRKTPGNRMEAWDEIEQGKVEDSWEIAPPIHCVGGIDMAFAAKQPCLVFVAISGDHSHAEEAENGGTVGSFHETTTYFGENIVAPMAIRGQPSAPIIKNLKRHKLPSSNYHTVCSFDVDGESALRELGSSSGAAIMTRFPIVFDFVDSDDGRSPVFKKPRRPLQPASNQSSLVMFGHGGIHPPNGASMIEFL